MLRTNYTAAKSLFSLFGGLGADVTSHVLILKKKTRFVDENNLMFAPHDLRCLVDHLNELEPLKIEAVNVRKISKSESSEERRRRERYQTWVHEFLLEGKHHSEFAKKILEAFPHDESKKDPGISSSSCDASLLQNLAKRLADGQGEIADGENPAPAAARGAIFLAGAVT
eukprot:3336891-Rhodomonas_salina.1